jgi:hypothetical protein
VERVKIIATRAAIVERVNNSDKDSKGGKS